MQASKSMNGFDGYEGVPRFTEAVNEGTVTSKGSYHQPANGCGCKLTTRKGAYRDVTVDLPNGLTVHYYHQSPIVVREGSKFRISSCGWQTSTTKERINRYLPIGYRVFQRDFTWYVSTPDGTVDFHDGMLIER